MVEFHLWQTTPRRKVGLQVSSQRICRDSGKLLHLHARLFETCMAEQLCCVGASDTVTEMALATCTSAWLHGLG
jgi:hypothetical protein